MHKSNSHTLESPVKGSGLFVKDFPHEPILVQTIRSFYQIAHTVVQKVNGLECEKSTILVADDEPLMFQLVEEMLLDAGIDCKIWPAINGVEALELAAAITPDLVITDWIMPEMDGLSLIRKLKTLESTRHIPIIVATGALATNEELDEILLAGAVDFIRKPVDAIELKARVKAALVLHRSLKETSVVKESVQLKNQFINFLTDALPNPMFYLDKSGRLLGCNNHLERLLNCKKGELLGKPSFEIFPLELANKIALCLSLGETPPSTEFEVQIQQGDQWMHILVSLAALGSQPQLLIGLITDVTKMVQSGNERLFKLQDNHEREREQFANHLEKLRDELDLNQRELAMNIELLIHSRSTKDQLIDEINKLRPFLLDEGKSKLMALLKQLNWQLSEEITLSVEKKFDEIHSPLYNKLQASCPEITWNEKRLCAYLKMNHSAAAIAKFTNRSVNSVNVGFARLRAKLGFHDNRELRMFITRLDPPAHGTQSAGHTSQNGYNLYP